MTVIERVKRLKEGGYNPIHLLGNFYLVRNKSKRYCKFSFYGIMKIKP